MRQTKTLYTYKRIRINEFRRARAARPTATSSTANLNSALVDDHYALEPLLSSRHLHVESKPSTPTASCSNIGTMVLKIQHFGRRSRCWSSRCYQFLFCSLLYDTRDNTILNRKEKEKDNDIKPRGLDKEYREHHHLDRRAKW